MPTFIHYLVGIGTFCDTYCTVKFSKHSITVYDPKGLEILTGWREHK